MGLFDDLRCDAPLPDGFPSPDNFQTKDFACELAKYTITADGKLKRGDEAVDFHGWLNFYTYTQNVWREYNAKFTDGQLMEIVLVEARDG